MASIPKTVLRVDTRLVRAKMRKAFAAMERLEKARAALNTAIEELGDSPCIFDVAGRSR